MRQADAFKGSMRSFPLSGADLGIRNTRTNHAISARRRKRRYLVGYLPGILLALHRFAPPELFERFYTGSLVNGILKGRP